MNLSWSRQELDRDRAGSDRWLVHGLVLAGGAAGFAIHKAIRAKPYIKL
jgi:hypothetical protein